MPRTYGTSGTGKGQADGNEKYEVRSPDQQISSSYTYQGVEESDVQKHAEACATDAAVAEEEEGKAMTDSTPIISVTEHVGREGGRFENPQRRIRTVGLRVGLVVAVGACVALFGARNGNGKGSIAPSSVSEEHVEGMAMRPIPGSHNPEELRQPEIRRAVDGVLDTTLRIQPARITNGPVSYSTRTYEGTVPGPTLLLRPGETLRIHQINGLAPEQLKRSQVVPQTLHWPNTTTIHTHGLHIDPSGIARGA
ncbi:multicopper oxidase [Nannochloropsis gaditana]|uniref:Multicopper oxidase n=1 Tax=Nannochloropsis gaditana TaxID=72520 RepID=W7TW84_9STRA|nr:multicopper oxidase [Nannochloropsis gaditana]